MRFKKSNGFRWLILSLLFCGATILYIDRAALGILAPEIQKSIGWSEAQYGFINSLFMMAYAVCFLVMGRLIDFIGTRRGYLVSIAVWSLAAIAHVFARSWVGFAVSRFWLAVGQSGSYPAAIKAVGLWFPKKDRSFAIAVFNGGSSVGTIIAPLVIPWVVLLFSSWESGFLWTFPLSILWVLLWLRYFRRPEESPDVSEEELRYIESDVLGESEETESICWRDMVSRREAWGIAVAKFIGDPIWWFYLFWGAKFLNERFGLNLKQIGPPFFVIYLVSWAGGILLGWFSTHLMNRGFSLNVGRKAGLLCCAFCALPVVLVPHVSNVWTAVVLIALAAGGHCGWSANVFSLMSDVFPKSATASIAGFGGFSGAVGGMLAALFVGKILQNAGVGGYVVPFAVAGIGYFIGLIAVHLLIPVIRPIALNKRAEQ